MEDNVTARLDAHGTQLDELRDCTIRLTALMEQAQAANADHEQRLRAMEAKGGQMMDKVAWAVIGGGIAIVVAYVATGLGLA